LISGNKPYPCAVTGAGRCTNTKTQKPQKPRFFVGKTSVKEKKNRGRKVGR
jgi:hypothetical protein